MKPADLEASSFGALPIADRRPPGGGVDEAALVTRVLAELAELAKVKLRVIRLAIANGEEAGTAEVRYDITFPSEPPMFQCRKQLEAAHYYVGQQMAEGQLNFYAVKRPPKYSDIGG